MKRKESKRSLSIALDVMGGDNAPESVIEGANLALKKASNVKFLLFGNKTKILPLLEKLPNLKANSEIIHTKDKIAAEEKPSIAIRQGRNSSMKLAIDAVKDGRADAVISAGNTGALMAMSKLALRTLDGIDRPAIASIIPTVNGKSVFLDMGANATCDANNLMQFAIMGDAFAKVMLGIENPTIGLLNIGSEELKGNEVIRVAHQMLQEEASQLNYQGYVEGDDIIGGATDIIVTDGFTGNIALKAIEGTAKICKLFLKRSYQRSALSFIGYLLSRRSLKRIFNKLDPKSHNGAMFLGLNGIAIKSHGNADSKGFANAIKVTIDLCRNNINDKIIEEVRLSNAAQNNLENPLTDDE